MIFYRNGVPGNAGYTAVLTSVAIVEEATSDFRSKGEYMLPCSKSKRVIK